MKNRKYLIIGRDEDEPFFHIIPEEEWLSDNSKFICEQDYCNHKRLDYLPSFDEFPSMSVFIMVGEIVK